MSKFIPEQSKQATRVPYFDDVVSDDGWKGQTTTKSTETLKSEITQAFGRLGGTVVSFQKGVFTIDDMRREGYRIKYNIENPDGTFLPGRIDIAALPVDRTNLRASYEKRAERSLRMALFMIRDAMDGLWFLQQLSPGYAALMPFLQAPGREETITELWNKTGNMGLLLPAGNEDFVEGEVKEL